MDLGSANGWSLFGDEHFLAAFENLKLLVREDQQRGKSIRNAKVLAAVIRVVQELVPSDPGSQAFLLGNTLGPEFRSWRRVKFLQQYRLFFRYSASEKVIIFSWFNDQNSLRAYGPKSDAYLVFQAMLESGEPPTNWQDLAARIS